jgi:hypothetical protein
MCFSIFLSLVCRDFAFSAAQIAYNAKIFLRIPANAGFISAKNVSSENKISIINIQDLHYNPSVQKNISLILENIERQISPDVVYVEGAVGEIDTGWISDIGDKKLRKDIAEHLILNSQLTGYEYYRAISAAGMRIYGIESEKVYNDNFLLLNKITDYKDETTRQLKIFNESVDEIAKSFHGERRLDGLIRKYREGKISQIKYYSVLIKLYDSFCGGKKLLNIAGYYPKNYLFNIKSFILNSREISLLSKNTIERQYADFYNSIKNMLPYKEYAVYSSLEDKTENTLRYMVRFELAKKYNELFSYLTCLKNLKSINPLELRNEEIRLIDCLRVAVSDNIVQQDMVFIKDFSIYFNSFFNNSITFDEYKYFSKNFKKFEELYSYYNDGGIPEFFVENFELFDKFISNNVLRNSVFAANILEVAQKQGYKNIVLITGGFHTEGLEEIFKDAGVNFIALTPNAILRKDTQDIYDYNVKKQSGVLNNAYALKPSSVLPEEERQRIILSAVESVRLLMETNPQDYNLKLEEIAGHIPILKGLKVKTGFLGDSKLVFTYIDGEIRDIRIKGSDGKKSSLKKRIRSLFPYFNADNYYKDIFKYMLFVTSFLFAFNINNTISAALMIFLFPPVAILILPAIQALMLSVYIFKDNKSVTESPNYALRIKEMPEGAEYLKQTTSIPVYDEPWRIIKRTLEYAIDARDRYNKKAGGEYANIVVSDDGLMVFAKNNIESALEEIERKNQNGQQLSTEEEEIYYRISFYKEHNIGVIARPKDKTKYSWGDFERRGLFKKASNLNHSLIINKILGELIENGMSYEDAVNSVKKQLINDKPIFENTYISGNIMVGDIILLLDKDSTVAPNAISATMTEFVIDTSLGYTQNQTVINNPDETRTSQMRAQEGDIIWKYVVPLDARNGFVKFLGHNGFIRRAALEKSGFWSEDNVAEDFAMIMKMITIKDDMTGRNYHGRQIQYEHITFEELSELSIEQLQNYASKSNIDLSETNFSYEEIIEKLAIFGYTRKEFNEILKTVKAQNSVPLRALNIMLNIYLESVMSFGEGMPEEPLEAIKQMSKFGFGTTELWLNPVKEWLKKRSPITPLYKGVLSAKHLDFFSKMNLTMGFIMFLYPVLITLFVFSALFSPFFPSFFRLDFIPLMLFTMLAVNTPIVVDVVKKNKDRGLLIILKALFPSIIERAVFNVSVMHNSAIGVINRLLGKKETFGATKVGKGEKTGGIWKNVRENLKIQYRAGYLYFSAVALVLALSLFFSLPLDAFIILAGLGSLNILQAMFAPVYFDSSLRKIQISKKFRDNIAYYGNSARKTVYWLSRSGNFSAKTAYKLLEMGFNNVVIEMDNSKKGDFLTRYDIDGINSNFSVSAAFENGLMRFYINSSNEDLLDIQKDKALNEALKHIKLLLYGSPFLSPDNKSLKMVKKLYSKNKHFGSIKFKDINFGDSIILRDSQDGVYKTKQYINALSESKKKNVIAKFEFRNVAQIKHLLKQSFYDEIFLSVENDKISADGIKKLSQIFKNRYVGLSIGVDFKQDNKDNETFIKNLSKNKNIKNLIINYTGFSGEQILESLKSFAALKQTGILVRIDEELLKDDIFISEISKLKDLGISLFQHNFIDLDFKNVNYGNYSNFIEDAYETDIRNVLFDIESFANMAARSNLAEQINLSRLDFDDIFKKSTESDTAAILENILSGSITEEENIDAGSLNIYNSKSVNAILQAA